MLDLLFVLTFHLHRMSQLCSVANAACTIIVIVTALIFIIVSLSQLHAFFVVVLVHLFCYHALAVVAVFIISNHHMCNLLDNTIVFF